MKKRVDELAVIVKAKDLGNYIFTVTDKSPKKFRFTLVSRMQNLILQVIEDLFRANAIYVRASNDSRRIEQRKEQQKNAYINLKLLGYFALMAREQICILPKQYEQISMQAEEVNRLLVAWARSDQKRYKG